MSDTLEVTAELLARYDRPGPRYTSYPTAPQFHEKFDHGAYAETLAIANRAAQDPLALYLHIPFCEERCLYCGCHVVIAKRRDVVRRYLDDLESEIALVAAELPDRRQVRQLHWGGGTPTHLTPDEMRELHAATLAQFKLQEGAEVAAEIDPRVTTPEHIATLAELGFNRLSFGVQDFTPEVQTAIGRFQTLEQTRDLLEVCRGHGITRFNVDLVYGLPRQTVPAFRESLERVLELKPGRVAVYSYAHVPWIRPHQRRIDEADLPSTRTKMALLAETIRTFTDAGYLRIGMDHFALPEDDLALAMTDGRLTRNFMGYTVAAAPDTVAFGISGIGEIAGAFAQNAKKLSTYHKALEAGHLPVERGFVLDRDDRIRRFVIRSIMCNSVLSFDALRSEYDVEFGSYFEADIGRLQQSVDPSFYEIDEKALRLTPLGQLFVRNVCMAFDRYLAPTDDEKPLYSRTV